MRAIASTLAIFALALAAPAVAQDQDGVGTAQMVFEHSGNDAASEPFLRGLALLHNFEYRRAAEAFKQAQAADADFVMAYWGEAMTYNHPLWEEQDRKKALEVLARLGATPGERRSKARNSREAAWLDAVETLYGEGSKEERDHAYLAKMRALQAGDPGDIDARAFTGLALLGTSHGGRQIPLYMEAAGLLEEGFMQHDRHPGILHYLIHSYDDPVHAPLGERAAERYAKVAPDAGHAQHMVSHIFHALGNWQASEEANINADAVVDRQRLASGRSPTNCGHYNEWLVYSLIQQGKDASAIVDGCRDQAIAHINGKSEGRLGWGAASSYADMAVRNGIETGAWPTPLDGMGDRFLLAQMRLAYGRALENFGNEEAVAAALARMRHISAQIAAAARIEAPDDRTSADWRERAVAQVEALHALSEGRADDGLALLAAAAEAEAALPAVFGPPAIPKPSYELLGEQLLALGRKEEAAAAFRKALAFSPGRRLSLQGLEHARK